MNVNVRMRKTGPKPTKAEAEGVLISIQDGGKVPKGWEVAVIRWTHAEGGSGNWRKGNVRDLRENFADVWEYLVENLRVGVDRARSGGDVWEIEIALEY